MPEDMETPVIILREPFPERRVFSRFTLRLYSFTVSEMLFIMGTGMQLPEKVKSSAFGCT